MDGVVVIGEGEKDEAPMLYNGEQIGDGSPPSMDIAVDPIDGTTLTSLGRGGAIAVIAMSERGTMFDPGPCVYMEKIAAGPAAADVIDLNAPVKATASSAQTSKPRRLRANAIVDFPERDAPQKTWTPPGSLTALACRTSRPDAWSAIGSATRVNASRIVSAEASSSGYASTRPSLHRYQARRGRYSQLAPLSVRVYAQTCPA